MKIINIYLYLDVLFTDYYVMGDSMVYSGANVVSSIYYTSSQKQAKRGEESEQSESEENNMRNYGAF